MILFDVYTMFFNALLPRHEKRSFKNENIPERL